MSWVTRYQIRLYLRNSLWIIPALGIIAGLLAAAILSNIEQTYGLELPININTAMATIGVVASSMFSLLVLVSSAILLVIQLVSGQLSPRVVTLIYRNPLHKAALAIFAFTFTFSVSVLARMADTVHLLTAYLAAYGFLINLGLFLYFIDNVGKSLRPSSVLRSIALLGREVVRSSYPHQLEQRPAQDPKAISEVYDEPSRIVPNKRDGVVLAFDVNGLISIAEKADCLIELVPQVGDFVSEGEPLFRLYGDAFYVNDQTLFDSIAFGTERTLEQDPTLAFRIMVDIASRALSPAINDPTTAVLAISQIENLLREVGRRYLGEGWATDHDGRVRLVYRTPDWQDFVVLAVTEIRHYGRDSIQIMRRLRAMLEDLTAALPKARKPLIYEELALLDMSLRRVFPDPDDQALAATGDFQGIGGNREVHTHTQTVAPKQSRELDTADNRDIAKGMGRAG